MESPLPVAANDDDPYFSTLYSIMRVTVAGFGGALAGLSFARRGGGNAAGRQVASALTKTSQGAAKGDNNQIAKSGNKRLQRQRPVIRTTPPTTRPYVDRDLPYAWAVACTAFAGAIEITRLVSPTTIIWELTRDFGHLTLANDESIHSSLVTISDYTIGGAIAGALFRGSAVRTQVGARLDASISNSSAIRGRGILPGAALGLVAGVAIVAMDRAQIAVEDYFGVLDDGAMEESDLVQDLERDEVPADIKAMSNEELRQSIESLREGKIESYDQNDDDSEPIQQMKEASFEDEREVHDLISALGFRPHPSMNGK